METTSYQVNKRRTKQEEKRKPNHLIETTRMTTTHRDIEEAVQQLKEEGVDIDSDTDECCAKQEEETKLGYLVEKIRMITTICMDILDVSEHVIEECTDECNV